MINFHHLYNFWMVATEGSVSAASVKLNVTQPTVSTLLQEFERTLGISLFSREGRYLALTENGQAALQYANDIFELGRELTDVLDGKAASDIHPFRVGIADVVPKILAQRIIDPVFTSSPTVRLRCLKDDPERLLARLALHELDLVISDSPIPPGLKIRAFHHPVLDCPVMIVASKKLVGSGKKPLTQVLKTTPLLVPSRGTALRRELDYWLEEKGISPLIRGEYEDTALMKIAGAHGHGAFPIPSVIANEVCDDYNLISLGTVTQLRYKLYLITLERKIKHPVVTAIIKKADLPHRSK